MPQATQIKRLCNAAAAPPSCDEDLPRGCDGLAPGQPSPRNMTSLFLIAEPGGLDDHLPGRPARIRPAGQAFRQLPGRPAPQRGDRRLARITRYRAELRQQFRHPGQRRPGLQVVVPACRDLPGRLVLPVTQVTQPARQRDGSTHDRAFPRPPRHGAKIISRACCVHKETLLPARTVPG